MVSLRARPSAFGSLHNISEKHKKQTTIENSIRTHKDQQAANKTPETTNRRNEQRSLRNNRNELGRPKLTLNPNSKTPNLGNRKP